MEPSRHRVGPVLSEPHRRRAGGARRSAVLDEVAAVLAERGYENTRFVDVSMASGVAISTLQNYFGSREDMLVEAMRHATELEVLAMEQLAASEPDPWKRLVVMMERSLDAPVRTHCLMLECWRSGIRDSDLRSYSLEGWSRYREPFVTAVTEGRDRGEFTLSRSPDDMADLLLATLAGAMVPRVLQFTTPSRDRFRAAILGQTATMLGLAAS
jgi:AcrR family transcriptional regulator